MGAVTDGTGLTANLPGFRIGASEGWPLLQRQTPVLDLAVAGIGNLEPGLYQKLPLWQGSVSYRKP